MQDGVQDKKKSIILLLQHFFHNVNYEEKDFLRPCASHEYVTQAAEPGACLGARRGHAM